MTYKNLNSVFVHCHAFVFKLINASVTKCFLLIGAVKLLLSVYMHLENRYVIMFMTTLFISNAEFVVG